MGYDMSPFNNNVMTTRRIVKNEHIYENFRGGSASFIK